MTVGMLLMTLLLGLRSTAEVLLMLIASEPGLQRHGCKEQVRCCKLKHICKC